MLAPSIMRLADAIVYGEGQEPVRLMAGRLSGNAGQHLSTRAERVGSSTPGR